MFEEVPTFIGGARPDLTVGREPLARRTSCEEFECCAIESIGNVGRSNIFDRLKQKLGSIVCRERIFARWIDVDSQFYAYTCDLQPSRKAPYSAKKVGCTNRCRSLLQVRIVLDLAISSHSNTLSLLLLGLLGSGSQLSRSCSTRGGLARCDVSAHELTNYLSGGTILRLARLDEVAPQFFVDSEFECHVFGRHVTSVPIVHPIRHLERSIQTSKRPYM